MENIMTSHKHSLDLIEQLQSNIEQDNYYLTRDDRDRLFYELERFKQKLNEIYKERTRGRK